MRVHHYIKNLLVFAPLACSGELFNTSKFIDCLVCFIGFCAVSSIVYIINDIKDADKDRLHPQKSKRPIASGEVSIKRSILMIAILGIVSIFCNLYLKNVVNAIFMYGYLFLNVLYSHGLKNIPILDIAILVSGFLIRIVCGSLSTSIVISNWLYLTVMALAMYLSLGKRRNEVKSNGCNTREVLKYYSVGFLDKGMMMSITLTNVFYALWSVDSNTINHYKNNYLLFTVPIVLFITLKYSMDVEEGTDGDPVEVLISDKILIAMCLLYFFVMFTVLYLV